MTKITTNKIVVVVGDKMLTYTDGSINFNAFKRISLFLSDLNNSGLQISLISAGAIVMGTQLLEIKERPETLSQKQAIAAIGQVELIKTYQDLFLSYGQHVAQVLLTRSTMCKTKNKNNIKATMNELLRMNIIPIINENDSVSTDDIELEDNYPLAARLAKIINAQSILLASDIQNKYHLIKSGDKQALTANNEEEAFFLIEELKLNEKGNFPEFRHEIILNSELKNN